MSRRVRPRPRERRATEPRRAANIFDVARLAGVSHQTVSRVLNDLPNVRPATRARVEQAIAQLRYSPSPAARALVTRRTRTIGLIDARHLGLRPDLDRDALQLRRPRRALQRRDGQRARRRSRGRSARSSRPAAAARRRDRAHRRRRRACSSWCAASTSASRVVAAASTARRSPLHRLDRPVPRRARGRAAPRRARAHPRSCTSAGPRTRPGRDRAGPRLARRARRAPPRGRRPAVRRLVGGERLPARRRAGHRARDRRCSSRNDHMAIGLLSALRERGLRVPEDVSVVGFDDVPGGRRTSSRRSPRCGRTSPRSASSSCRRC